MIVHEHAVAGETVTINVIEREEDLDGFRDFIRENLRFLAVDSETTGLDIYGDDFRCRVVQFGTPTEAWVIPVERGPRYVGDVVLSLGAVQGLVLHNASFDLQVFERCLGVPMEELWPKVTDTRILAHLIDPRGRMEGGVGHSLEDLVRHYVDPPVADNVKGLMNMLRLRHKTTKAHIWKVIEFEDPDYQLYSGMDPILAARLLRALLPLVPAVSKDLVPYEHRLAEVCSYIERTGFLLDVDYTEKLSDQLKEQEAVGKWLAAEMGCENVNSTEMVADVIEARGTKIKGRTPSGKRKVDKTLLEQLVAEGDEFAKLVQETKKAGKWEKTWVRNFLEQADADARCHPHINPLQARTARMSITGIPAQTLPSGDWMIRRCFLADEGHLIASVDYQAQELRVLAALSSDRTMIQAFKEGADLHLITAIEAFGERVHDGRGGFRVVNRVPDGYGGFRAIDKDSPERKYAKVVNFGRVYGGGAKTVSVQTGLDFPTAKRVVEAFDRRYPGVADHSAKLAAEASENGFIITPAGRRLPVDPTRAYAALNFEIQSSSRDVTGRALIRLHEAGFTPYIRLPIHDEILASLPEQHADWGAQEIGRIMAEEMGPVHIGTDPEVGGRSWGSLYGSDT